MLPDLNKTGKILRMSSRYCMRNYRLNQPPPSVHNHPNTKYSAPSPEAKSRNWKSLIPITESIDTIEVTKKINAKTATVLNGTSFTPNKIPAIKQTATSADKIEINIVLPLYGLMTSMTIFLFLTKFQPSHLYLDNHRHPSPLPHLSASIFKKIKKVRGLIGVFPLLLPEYCNHSH